MHLGNLHFKNMDEELKEKIYKKTAKIFEHLANNYTVTGSFERTALGDYRGLINGHSDHGDFHVHASDSRLDSMIANLKKKVRSQFEKQKNREKASRHNTKEGERKKDNLLSFHAPQSAHILDTIALELHNKPVPKVLIIDDDMEAIIPIEMIFRDMGCITSFAIDRDEAINKLKHMPADIIILDWMLDRITGGELIRNISLEGEAFTIEHGYKPKVITYSGLEDKQIAFPKNHWFEHIKHWNKPIKFDEVSSEAKTLLHAMGF